MSTVPSYPSPAIADPRRPSFADDMSAHSRSSTTSSSVNGESTAPAPAAAATAAPTAAAAAAGPAAATAAPSSSSTLQRPRLGSRKSSGTIIIPRDSDEVELQDEEYDDGDARTMSPRRSSEEIERMGHDARQALMHQAKALQASLLEIVDRVEVVRCEHEKLEGGNKFLQSYIGELMQTSKITAASATKAKAKGRLTK